MDPEKYVDVHVALSEFLADDVLVQEDEQMHIWKHLRSSGCSKYYHVEQEWFWQKVKKAEPRRYSFLGLYRKYSEADMHELIRLQQASRRQNAMRLVEQDSLYASFNDESVFSIFANRVKVLTQIERWLDNEDFPKDFDEEYNELENSTLRRIYFVLAKQNCNKPLQKPLEVNKLDPQSLHKSIYNSNVSKLDEVQDEDDKATKYACNSILYRIMHSDNPRCRDLIFEIARFCEEFSIANFLVSQDDIKKLVQQPSA